MNECDTIVQQHTRHSLPLAVDAIVCSCRSASTILEARGCGTPEYRRFASSSTASTLSQKTKRWKSSNEAGPFPQKGVCHLLS